MKRKAPEIGLVLGLVFVIMGVASSRSGVWMLGLIFLAVGLYENSRKGNKNKD